jgi:hypothetical protein
MKKTIIIAVLFLVFISCKKMDNDAKNDTIKGKKESKDSTIVGADKDENGCLASAGYTWSKLNKECVRIFTGIQLDPANNPNTDDETLCAYVLFNEKADKAEVFLPDEKSFILTRSGQGKPWIYNDYQLIPKNGYVLTKAGTTIYSGDGQIGSKVKGSDNQDGQE